MITRLFGCKSLSFVSKSKFTSEKVFVDTSISSLLFGYNLFEYFRTNEELEKESQKYICSILGNLKYNLVRNCYRLILISIT